MMKKQDLQESAAAAFKSPPRRRSSMLVSRTSKRGSKAQFLIMQKDTGASTGTLLADLMEKAGAGWYQLLAMPSLLGVTMVECGQVQLLASLASAFQAEWGLSAAQKAAIPSLGFCGLAIGTCLSGFLSDNYGRRKAVLAGFAASACTSTALVLASTFPQMALMVLLNGIACGIGVTAAMVMITELCPSQVRSMAFVLPLLAQAFGEVYAIFVMDMVMPDLIHGSWRKVVLSSAVLSYFFLFYSYNILRESPYWLVVQGRVFEGRAEVLEIARLNGTTERVKILAETLGSDTIAQSSSMRETEPMTVTLGKAFRSNRFIINTLVFSFLCFLGQLLTFGMSYFWPEFLGTLTAKDTYFHPATALGVIRSFGIPSALLIIPIMRSSIGHRWVIGAASLVEALTIQGCVLILVHMSLDTVVPIAGLSLACSSLFYATVLLFMTESYPTAVRAAMVSVCISFGRLGAFCGPALVEYCGYSEFLSLTAALACCATPLLLMLVETKGKQLEDFLEDEQAAARQNDIECLRERTPLLSGVPEDYTSESGDESSSASSRP